jgi:hypothetical protein
VIFTYQKLASENHRFVDLVPVLYPQGKSILNGGVQYKFRESKMKAAATAIPHNKTTRQPIPA